MNLQSIKRHAWWAGGLGVLLFVAAAFAAANLKSPLGQVATITRGNLVEAAYAVGTVKADRTYNLKTGVASRVIDRYVRIGDKVKKGQPLMNLEGFPVYRAPFDGVITALAYEKGELVFAQTVVITLVDLDSLYLELSLDERTVGSIKKGQQAKISFEGQRSETKTGTVRSIYASEGSFLVVVDASFGNLSLLPGMTCDVAVEVGSYKNKLLVPLGAVATAGHVTVMKSQPTDVVIETGASDGSFAVIAKGNLQEGDQVKLRVVDHSKDGGGPH